MLTSHVRRLLPLLLSACLIGSSLLAQDSVPGPAPVPAPDSNAPGSGVVIQENTSGLYLEWSLVAIAVGVAIFAVCRSSRRN